jgi:hypothetical protein
MQWGRSWYIEPIGTMVLSGQEREVNYVEKENLNGGSAISHGRHVDGSGA